tara:strand:- start:422 stop:1750 length:1329 start_codon:yes stop_codon:yes gene_type:complete
MQLTQYECIGHTNYYNVSEGEWSEFLRPDNNLSCFKLAANNNIYPDSANISVWKILCLRHINLLQNITHIVEECLEKNITLVVQAAHEFIVNTQDEYVLINERLNSVNHLLSTDKIKILISQPLHHTKIDPQYHKYFVYYNYQAQYVVYNVNSWGNPNHIHEKLYIFSYMIGVVFKQLRVYFLTECFRKKLKDQNFYTCAIPFLHDVEKIFLEAATNKDNFINSYTLESESVSKIVNILRLGKLQINNNHLDDLEAVLSVDVYKSFPEVTKSYLKNNFNDIIFNHPFVDHRGNETTLSKLENYLWTEHRHVQTHWDKIIPLPVYQSWINIVCEDPCDNLYPYFSEKTYKPIFAGIPFINISSQYFIEPFTELGFEPYVDLFDYAYQNESDPLKRIDKIIDNLQSLQHDFNLYDLLRNQIPIIEHNQNNLKKIAEDFLHINYI